MAMCPPCNSGPKVEDEKDPFAKLKSSGVASLTDREIFDMWRAFWDGKTYRPKTEEDQRFRYFQQAIVDKPPTQYEARHNLHYYADRSKEELEEIFWDFPQDQKPNAFIFKSDIKSWPMMVEVDKDFVQKPTDDSSPKVEDEKDPFAKLKSSGVASLTDREIFDMWKVMVWGRTKAYDSNGEENERFCYFQKAIRDKPQTQDEARYNIDIYADRSKDELETIFCLVGQENNVFIFKSDIKYWPMIAEFNSLFFIEEPTDSVPKVEDEK